MPFDNSVYDAPARRGDIAGTAISTSLALGAIADALEQINATGKADPERIALIRKQSDRLAEIFDDLTGWTP